MKTSLRIKLNSLIAQRGQVSWSEIKDLVESGKLGKMAKISAAERRLRPSESPLVEAVMKGNHIDYYRWLGVKQQAPQYKILKVEGLDLKVKIKI